MIRAACRSWAQKFPSRLEPEALETRCLGSPLGVEMFDSMLGDFKWYRKLVGGDWNNG